MKIFRLFGFLLLVSFARAARRWSPETYPNPLTDVSSCGRRGVKSWLCDPDGVITYESANVVEGIIKRIHTGQTPYALGRCGSYGLQGYQVAVALMRSMKYTGDAGAAAGEFARSLHNRWGVGDARCNNGVLLLISIDDRQIFISSGSGASSLLTYDVMGDIIADVRPALRDQRYNEAVERAVVDIGLALAGRPVEPEGDEGTVWQELLGLGIFGSVVGGIIFFSWRADRRKRRRYHDCKSKLEKLKRDQAAVRASTYNPTSCPVCLEDFVPEVPAAGAAGTPRSDSGAADGSRGDVQMGACAPCGADKCDASKVPSSSSPGAASSRAAGRQLEEGPEEDDVRKPLLHHERAGGPGDVAYPSGDEPSAPPLPGPPPAPASAPVPRGDEPQPSQRRPLVLPCGHAFCEPCITQWLDQKKVTCPICRKPFDDDDDPAPSTDLRDSLPRPPRPDTVNNGSSNRDSAGPSSAFGGAGPSTSGNFGSRPPCTADDDNDFYVHPGYGSTVGTGAPRLRLRWGSRPRPVRLHEDLLMAEMLFRLRQLQRQHPDYISTSMLHSWEQDMQSGREFNAQQLRQFQLNDPATRRELAYSGSSGTGVSFGGGRSSGGRGGSW